MDIQCSIDPGNLVSVSEVPSLKHDRRIADGSQFVRVQLIYVCPSVYAQVLFNENLKMVGQVARSFALCLLLIVWT